MIKGYILGNVCKKEHGMTLSLRALSFNVCRYVWVLWCSIRWLWPRLPTSSLFENL